MVGLCGLGLIIGTTYGSTNRANISLSTPTTIYESMLTKTNGMCQGLA